MSLVSNYSSSESEDEENDKDNVRNNSKNLSLNDNKTKNSKKSTDNSNNFIKKIIVEAPKDNLEDNLSKVEKNIKSAKTITSIASFLPPPKNRNKVKSKIQNQSSSESLTKTSENDVNLFIPHSVAKKLRNKKLNALSSNINLEKSQNLKNIGKNENENENENEKEMGNGNKNKDEEGIFSLKLNNVFGYMEDQKSDNFLENKSKNMPGSTSDFFSSKDLNDIAPGNIEKIDSIKNNTEEILTIEKNNENENENEILDIEKHFNPRNRNKNSGKINIIEYNATELYEENERLKAEGKLESIKRPIKHISGGKHQLSSLLFAATSQKEQLEETFANNKRTKKETGSKYGFY